MTPHAMRCSYEVLLVFPQQRWGWQVSYVHLSDKIQCVLVEPCRNHAITNLASAASCLFLCNFALMLDAFPKPR